MIKREWRDGDRVEIHLPMRTALEPLPADPDYVAVMHGPILLAAKTSTDGLDGLIAGDARMGHVAPGAYQPLDAAPMLVGERATMAGEIRPAPDRSLTFTAPTLVRPEAFRELELIPFFRVHDARYMLYWRATSPQKYAEVVAALEAHENERLDLERRTVDQVAPGEQQPEVEHNYRGVNSISGTNLGRGWRDAGDWFSYDMRAPAGGPLELHVTTFGRERNREFTILVNEHEIAAVNLAGDQGERFVETVHAIPSEVTAAAPSGVLTVKFVARSGSRAGGIYGVRLVRTAPVP
jgi:hypothetical protein